MMNFEKKVEELENLLKQLENPDVSLEDSVALFEQGVNVTKECLAFLEENKGKIDAVKIEMKKLFDGEDV